MRSWEAIGHLHLDMSNEQDWNFMMVAILASAMQACFLIDPLE